MTGTNESGRSPIAASSLELLEAAPDAVFVTDDEGLIRLVNRQAVLLFGYPADELLGHSIDVLLPASLRSRHARHRGTYLEAPVPRAMAMALDPVARHKDGTEIPVGITLSTVTTAGGRFTMAAVRDITDRKRMEAARGAHEARFLEAEHDEERAELEGQLHQAQRLESVGQLAGGIAHDFNNLIAGIMNYAGLVSESLQQEMAARQLADDPSFMTLAQDVEEITKVARRAATLTRQLLIFSRRTVVQPTVFDLNDVVLDMETLLRTTINDHVELRTSLAPGLPLIRADRGQLDQVVMNLTVNARDAMAAGGELTIETSVVDVDARTAALRDLRPGTYARLSVSDTGTGMDAATVDRAFEPFFTTKPHGAGTGLGLATVYGIVAQAGGDVSVYSEPGMGTTIRINLPATEQTRDAPITAPPERPLAADGETILLVEDEETVREPARRILVGHGYAVVAAASAEEALGALAGQGTIDLLLTDVVMPGLSGKELAEALLVERPATKVLFMSGYSQDLIAHQGVLDPGVHLIEKPFSADDLLRKVRHVLDVER